MPVNKLISGAVNYNGNAICKLCNFFQKLCNTYPLKGIDLYGVIIHSDL